MNLKKPNNTFNVDYAMQISNILLVVGQNMEKSDRGVQQEYFVIFFCNYMGIQ